jgi:hypothetical protein
MARVAVGVVAAVAALGWQPEPAESASQKELRRGLQLVVRASREQFRPMRGARIDIRPGSETWFDARHTLPGADSCRVYEHPLLYTCRWEKAPGRGDMQAFLRSLTAEVEAALGDGWERSGGEEARFREKEEGSTVTLALAGGAVRLTVTQGVRRRP